MPTNYIQTGALTTKLWRHIDFSRLLPQSWKSTPQNDCHQWLFHSCRMHQIRFCRGSTPWTSLGELTALPRPLSWFKEALLLRRRGGKGSGGEGRKDAPYQKFLDPPLVSQSMLGDRTLQQIDASQLWEQSAFIAIFKRSLKTFCSCRLRIQRVRDDFSFNGLYMCTF